MLNDIINLLNNNYIFISFQGIATLPLIVFYLSFRSCHHTHRFQSLISLRYLYLHEKSDLLTQLKVTTWSINEDWGSGLIT